MFDRDAIEKLQEGDSVRQVIMALSEVDEGQGHISDKVIAVPASVNLESLEKYMPGRFRMRGTLSTPYIDSFIKNSIAHAVEGTQCFVDHRAMSAVCIFNIGTKIDPGHCDHAARLQLERSPEYNALLHIAKDPCTQKGLAEWIEDWSEHLSITDQNGAEMKVITAVNAVRKISIDAARKLGSEVQNFSSSRSTLETIDAKSDEGLPGEITFTCIPYPGLKERGFKLRVSIMTGGDSPKFSLHIRSHEVLIQEMAEELCTVIESGLNTDCNDTPIYIGSYSEAVRS